MCKGILFEKVSAKYIKLRDEDGDIVFSADHERATRIEQKVWDNEIIRNKLIQFNELEFYEETLDFIPLHEVNGFLVPDHGRMNRVEW